MIIDITGKLVIQAACREWCKMPYLDHSKGCPNFGRSKNCPPKAASVNEVFDLRYQHWFAVEPFNIAAHTAALLRVHPEWSERQARCCLYWQNGVRARLQTQCLLHQMEHPGCVFTLLPEAMGVNVFRTCHRIGIKMRKNPKTIIYKIALMGTAKENIYVT
jgi:predicted metal-binding protein